jgi:phenylacetate-coenzyme A ligase PaaK-like adenylate-forming protein
VSTVFDPFSQASAAAAVLSLAGATPASVCHWQAHRLKQLLADARQRSAFYRQHLRLLPEDATTLDGVQPVSRSELMDSFDDWVTDPRIELSDLKTFLADPRHIGQAYLGQYLAWESSGTSGEPGVFVQDGAALSVYDALETLRRPRETVSRRWLDPFYLTERTAFLGATGGHFASYVSLERLRSLQPWLQPVMKTFSILDPVDALVESLNEFAPTVLATYPTAALMLAYEAEQGRLNIHLHELWTGGETMSPCMRSRIERVLQCRVRNSYGSSEFLAMGWECSHGHMHLNSDWVLLEPVDEHNRPVPGGQPSCGVLLTNLANRVQPLIRYQMGDQVTLSDAPCNCGSPLPVIEVKGRQDDILHMQGVSHVVPLLPLALSTVLEEEAGVFDFQLRQRDDHTLVLRLPQAGETGRLALERCRQALQAYCSAQGTTRIQVLGELGQPIPRGRSGKLCRIQARSVH